MKSIVRGYESFVDTTVLLELCTPLVESCLSWLAIELYGGYHFFFAKNLQVEFTER